MKISYSGTTLTVSDTFTDDDAAIVFDVTGEGYTAATITVTVKKYSTE